MSLRVAKNVCHIVSNTSHRVQDTRCLVVLFFVVTKKDAKNVLKSSNLVTQGLNEFIFNAMSVNTLINF